MKQVDLENERIHVSRRASGRSHRRRRHGCVGKSLVEIHRCQHNEIIDAEQTAFERSRYWREARVRQLLAFLFCVGAFFKKLFRRRRSSSH